MRCPQCQHVEDRVIDTRVCRAGESIRRRRECLGCGNRFTTYEVIVRTEKQIVKRDGRREDFDPEKLRTGIRRACGKRPISVDAIDSIIQKVASHIEQRPDREIPSQELGEMIMNELRGLDEVAYVRFASVYRHFQDVDDFVDTVRTLTDPQNGPEAG